MWHPQLERLSAYHCLAPDLPEQGQSSTRTPFTLEGAALDVADLIRARGAQRRAHVVGLSLGGAVALTLVRVAPECVDHAVVSGTAAGLGRVLGALSNVSAYLYRYLNRELLINLSIKQFRIPLQYQAMVREDLRRSATEAFTRHYTAALMAMQLPTQSTAPTLAAAGRHETWVAKQAARKIVATVPQARGAIAPQVGHLWSLQDPDLFTAMVRAWCEDLPSPATLRPL
jgi:pimeloyl-ACP methyl ester carboxylesterase